MFFFVTEILYNGIHKGKLKVALNEKWKKLHGFSFSINISNFEAFLSVFKLTKKPLFLKSGKVPPSQNERWDKHLRRLTQIVWCITSVKLSKYSYPIYIKQHPPAVPRFDQNIMNLTCKIHFPSRWQRNRIDFQK